MEENIQITEEARERLLEIIHHESEPDYWKNRISNLELKDITIIRRSFEELRNSNLISFLWDENIPYDIQIKKDGYLYADC